MRGCVARRFGPLLPDALCLLYHAQRHSPANATKLRPFHTVCICLHSLRIGRCQQTCALHCNRPAQPFERHGLTFLDPSNIWAKIAAALQSQASLKPPRTTFRSYMLSCRLSALHCAVQETLGRPATWETCDVESKSPARRCALDHPGLVRDLDWFTGNPWPSSWISLTESNWPPATLRRLALMAAFSAQVC